MKRAVSLLLVLMLVFSACGNEKENHAGSIGNAGNDDIPESTKGENSGNDVSAEYGDEVVHVELSDDSVKFLYGELKEATEDGAEVGITTAHDIIYYPEGKDFTFGEGEKEDEHSVAEAEEHLVVHISKPGTYRLTGSLSAGQIAVDLGDGAEEDPNAVVILILDNADISCRVAPAVIFYEVYECGDKENGTAEVDTSGAGANVIIADGSENNINGSYVARIYKEGTVVLSEDGTEVTEAKKLHKYDGAFYSKMSMNVGGGEKGDGVLNIVAENEGLDSELHLTINGGNINIVSGNDGINTNEDGISVTTVNGGSLKIRVNGETGEGDGIDSNGYLVINGGMVVAEACSFSGDAGIDSDMGIYINGGTVFAAGNMLDRIAGGNQTYAVFQFAGSQKGGENYLLKNEGGETVLECQPENDFAYLIMAGDNLEPGTYTFWKGDVQLAGAASDGMMGGFGGFGPGGFGGQQPGGNFDPGEMQLPEGMERPEDMELPEGMTLPEGMEIPDGGELPEDMTLPEGMEKPEGDFKPEDMELPEGMEIPEGNFGGSRPGGFGSGGFGQGGFGQGGYGQNAEVSKEFVVQEGGNQFSSVTEAE